MNKTFPILILLFAACSNNTENRETSYEESSVESVDTSYVSFLNIEDGDTLESPFVMEMGVEGMTVEPKGPVKEGVGHHHLFINDDYFEKGVFIAADSTHIHYGGGETVDTVALEPGSYKLTLQFADGMHTSYGKNYSTSIQVTVR